MEGSLSLPVFAFVEEATQISELGEFLNQRGVTGLKIDPSNTQQSIVELVSKCDQIGQAVESHVDVEGLLNSITSLIIGLSLQQQAECIRTLCARVTTGETYCDGIGWQCKGGAAVRVLSNLFHGCPQPKTQKESAENSDQPHRQSPYHIYCALVQLAGNCRLIGEMPTDLSTLRLWFSRWGVSVEQKRHCLRLLHAALLANAQQQQLHGERTAEVMLELLSTYTGGDATEAVKEAKECVRAAIVHPSTFIYDYLLRLRPVLLLEQHDADIWTVLNIFVQGTLKEFLAFTSTHPDYVRRELKMDSMEGLIDKMRILTLISMAEKAQELSFPLIAEELRLDAGDDLESFIIRAIQTDAIQAKMDQVNERLLVTNVRNRRFEKAEWALLRQKLANLSENLLMAHRNLEELSAVERQAA